MCLRFLLELMCRLLAFHRLILPDPKTLKRFLAEDLVLMVLFVVVRVRVGESVVAVGNCAVVRWTRDDSLGANRANNMLHIVGNACAYSSCGVATLNYILRVLCNFVQPMMGAML